MMNLQILLSNFFVLSLKEVSARLYLQGDWTFMLNKKIGHVRRNIVKEKKKVSFIPHPKDVTINL